MPSSLSKWDLQLGQTSFNRKISIKTNIHYRKIQGANPKPIAINESRKNGFAAVRFD